MHGTRTRSPAAGPRAITEKGKLSFCLFQDASWGLGGKKKQVMGMEGRRGDARNTVVGAGRRKKKKPTAKRVRNREGGG